MSMQPLLTQYSMGDLTLKNRMVMAPMTRNRADADLIQGAMNAEYYRQRATAGLIITEASQVSAQGAGYPATPGIYTEAMAAGWRKVTDAVHEANGLIFLQLWHVGRISHPEYQNGAPPVAPSPVQPAGKAMLADGFEDFVLPRGLETDEIARVVADFRNAARLARQAGFDGVELHGANGYLIDQFLQENTNLREDRYGGSLENRARFLFEVLEAVTAEWPSGRVGLRLSPSGTFNDMGSGDPRPIFTHVIERLNESGLAYLHLVGPSIRHLKEFPKLVEDVAGEFGSLYKGTTMINGGYTRETGNAAIADGLAELVSFGVLYLANPDLPRRFELNAELNEPHRRTFYGGGPRGYTDYPTLDD